MMVTTSPAGQAAPQAPPMVKPSFCMTFGALGSGKSTDLVAAGAGNWFFFAPPGGLRVDLSTLGISLAGRVKEVWCLEDALALLPQVKAAGFGGVGVDDASVLLEHSLNRSKQFYAYLKGVKDTEVYDATGRLNPGIILGGDGKAYKVTGYDRELWSVHERLLIDFATQARYLDLHVGMTGHVQEPFTDKQGWRQRGGMDVAWAKITPELPEKADLVQMAVPWPDVKEWDGRCIADRNHPDYALKDRHDVLPGRGGPLNTAEVLREYARRIAGPEAGLRSVPRPAGLEWMEAFVERAALKMLEGVPEADVIKTGSEHLRNQNIPFALVRWAIRDGVHRGRLRLHAKSGWDRL